MSIVTFGIKGVDEPISLIADDDLQVFHMQRGDGYEAQSLEAWASLINPEKVALDVGAYTGLYSIVAARKGALVLALEPMPANLRRLELNVELNNVHVSTWGVAASDTIGLAHLYYNPKVPLTSGASLENGIAVHSLDIIVDTTTIDALALGFVGAIKIDVERHELAVLRGARATIERDRPPILIETLDDEMRQAVQALLSNYRQEAILDGRNTLFLPEG
jgi:FkbM family methyltransferase